VKKKDPFFFGGKRKKERGKPQPGREGDYSRKSSEVLPILIGRKREEG